MSAETAAVPAVSGAGPAEEYLEEVLAGFALTPAGSSGGIGGSGSGGSGGSGSGSIAGGVRRHGQGHINDTFLVRTRENRRYILQRISPAAFRHPEQVMANVVGVTQYLREKIRLAGGDPDRETLQVIRCRDGAPFYRDRDGCAWRLFPYIANTACYQTAHTPSLFAGSGRAFGRFARLLDRYPAETLFETIPRFHDTPDRLVKLKAAAEEDSLGRRTGCLRELEFALQREEDCGVTIDAMQAGALPLRVTHNDTKLNNVLFDARTGDALCVIDLDTVMPGLVAWDFGDSIRFGANHCAEDEPDLGKVNLDLDLYQAYAEAYLEGTGGVLTPMEVRYLPWGARLMTLECGIRFLTDYLLGDTYFHTSRPGQNLDRCRTQFKLVSDMEAHWEEMQDIVQRAAARVAAAAADC